MTTEITDDITRIDSEIGEIQKKLDDLKKQIDDSNKKKAELVRKNNEIDKILVPYKKLLENVSKAKENIEDQAKKKRAIIDCEFNDDEKKKTLNNNIESAIKEVDDKITALETEENEIEDQQTIIEDEIKANIVTIANFEILKNYPKTIKIEEDIKKFTELKGKLEKEQISSRSYYLLDHELKPVLEEAKVYKTNDDLQKELTDAFDAAEKARADKVEKDKQLKIVQSELAAKLQEKVSLKNNREAEILKLLK